jgi:replicative DNA helicase
MSNEAVVSREIAHSAEVPMYLLRRPELIRNKERVLSQLTQGAIKEANRNLMIVDRGLTAPRVLVLSEMVHFSQGLDFVIVDYDQLVVRSGMKAGDDQFAAQAQFIANCLDLAKRLKICIMVLCQPRKVPDEVARGQRIPRLEDIFGSSAIANAAHQVLWVMRKYQQRDMQVKYEREAFLHHLKARNDKPTAIRMEFDPELVLFKQAPRRDKDSVEEKTES